MNPSISASGCSSDPPTCVPTRVKYDDFSCGDRSRLHRCRISAHTRRLLSNFKHSEIRNRHVFPSFQGCADLINYLIDQTFCLVQQEPMRLGNCPRNIFPRHVFTRWTRVRTVVGHFDGRMRCSRQGGQQKQAEALVGIGIGRCVTMAYKLTRAASARSFLRFCRTHLVLGANT